MAPYHHFNRNITPDDPVKEIDAESHKVAAQVCEALGAEWHMEPTYDHNGGASLCNSVTGLVLIWHAITKSYNGMAYRWQISGAVWRGGNEYRLPEAEITVAVSKTPQQIAADIKRRLLEVATANHEKIKLDVIGYALDEHDMWELAQRLAARFPGVRIETEQQRHDGYRQPCGLRLGAVGSTGPFMEVKFRASRNTVELSKVTDAQLWPLLDLVTSWGS